MKFDILNRVTGSVQVSVEIECAADVLPSVKLGLAVKAAIKEKANLSSADLRSANLSSANLSSANLRSADLRSADLCWADLSSADLCSAYLSSADLRSANLRSADLCWADLRSAKNFELPIARTRILPEGQLIGWKKLIDGSIAKLSIPAESKRSHAFGRKCRAQFVDVLEGFGVSQHDGVTSYAPGIRVTCDKWDDDWMQECAGGIHFYITKIEAENH